MVRPPDGIERRVMPWKPSHPAMTSQVTTCRSPRRSVYDNTGCAESSPLTAVPLTSNSSAAPAAVRAAIRSFTISVCA